MIKYHPSKSHIHLVVRAFLTHKNNTVLCRVRGESWFFLPGGHIENGESARRALLREFKEEIGDNNYNILKFIGLCESIFELKKDVLQQGVDIVFRVNVLNNFKISIQKKHIEFVSVKTEDLEKYNILPAPLKESLLKWQNDNQIFLKELAT